MKTRGLGLQRTRTIVGRTAERLRQLWEVLHYVQDVKTYLEFDCGKSLLSQLDYEKLILFSRVENINSPCALSLELLSSED